ncbi:uncharacterized protein E5676_scaffold282G00240 [Cucumis melo var. makuwa]|uniref:Zinc finger protein ZPR1-like protein n=1 Tax=Cucumis melo var. makuwa TaxID=1194695 RepID=A0A5A7UMN9_CUCMM|nr:uncharacterized protein E6C27_scaffold221G001080 [Cucumis melo var. makuwa]TYJ95723.1 uncharacterized protein E5676_scaffold282G00240 [Cucumis melo var. makuwa]
MLELQSKPTLKDTQPLSSDKICEMLLGRQSSYSKGFGWGHKSKARKTAGMSSSSTLYSQSTIELQLQAALDQAMQQIEEHIRNHNVLALEVERMRKFIEYISWAQQGSPHDPYSAIRIYVSIILKFLN